MPVSRKKKASLSGQVVVAHENTAYISRAELEGIKAAMDASHARVIASKESARAFLKSIGVTTGKASNARK